MPEYDLVVAGAGSAGGVIAARVTRRSGGERPVDLLVAGENAVHTKAKSIPGLSDGRATAASSAGRSAKARSDEHRRARHADG